MFGRDGVAALLLESSLRYREPATTSEEAEGA
jgi:hypothetical protein